MNRNTSDLTVEELSRIVAPIAVQYNMKRVYLFGSRARGNYRPDSNYDFCVFPGEHCSMLTLGGFITDLKDALGQEVDLVYEDCIGDEFKDCLRDDGILLYEMRHLNPERC